MKKKLLIAAVALLCTLTVGIGTTLAYLASISGPVINSFTVGQVELRLVETTGDAYRLIPGTTVEKDPVVTVVSGSEACYLYVKLERHGNLDSYVTYETEEGWHILGGFDGVYYRSLGYAAVDMSYHVLKNDQLTVRSTLTKEQMAAVDPDECRMTVTAYAIQATGIESPSDGWYNILSALEE
ncbi:MAG: hypothetical protein IKM42_06990 [Clostridia bacterium]|nr:hypothetical protein [Clostridia bacterium]MBR7111939.1 hypothetical protein [Clostridia bacterium]